MFVVLLKPLFCCCCCVRSLRSGGNQPRRTAFDLGKAVNGCKVLIMAVLKKLAIGGVRSFGADDADHQFIDFDKPFTLILGRNGCGKTTIIEALKYACTGTFPAGQGSSFVRDPKLDRRIETRAQIKLQFISCQGNETVVARLLQSTQKVKNISTTAMDSTISITMKNGKKNQLSGRCADIDELMGQHLGVSKPILNYVIFCHQEESFWPLDEGKKVKERFDEIFDSSSYNKCLEQIRKIRNDSLPNIRIEKEKLKNLKQNVGIRRQKVGELEFLIKERDKLEQEIIDSGDQSAEMTRELNSWSKRYDAYRVVQKEKDSLKTELHGLKSKRDSHKEFISVPFSGTKEELEQVIKNFDDELDSKRRRLDDIGRDKGRVDRTEQITLKEKSIVENKIGKLEADKDREQDTQKERNSKLSSLASALGLPALKTKASENDVNDFTNSLKKEINTLASSISSLKVANEREQNALQVEIQKHRDAGTKLEAEINMKTASIKQNYKEIEEKEQLLKSVNTKLAKKQEIDKDLEKWHERHNNALLEEDSESLSSAIAKLKSDTENLESQQNKLSTEVREIAKHQEFRKALETDEKKFTDQQNIIRKLRSKNEDFISCHLSDSDDSTLKHKFDLLVQKFKKQYDKLINECHEKKKEESSLQKDLEISRNTLKKKKEELDQHKDKIYEECGRTDLETVLKKTKEGIETLQNDKGLYTASAVVTRGYIQDLKKRDPCCPLCDRSFDNEEEPFSLVQTLELRLDGMPEKIGEVTEKLVELQSKQERLLELKPLQNTISELQETVIPNLETAITDCEDKLGEMNGLIASLELSKSEAAENMSRAEKLGVDIYDIDRSQKECKQLSRVIEKLKKDHHFSATSRNLDEALAEQEVVRVDLLVKRKDKNDKEARLRSYEKKINDINQTINSLTAEQLKIKEFIQQEDALKERVEDLKTLNSALENEKEELNVKLKPAQEEQCCAEKKLATVKQLQKKSLEDMEKKKGDVDREMGVITELQKTLLNFKNQKISEMLIEYKEKNESFASKLDSIKEEREALNLESKKLSSLIGNHTRERKEMDENLKLIEVEKMIAQQEVRLKEKTEELGSWDIKTIEDKCVEFQGKRQDLVSKVKKLEGTLIGKNENIDSRKKELNLDTFKTVEQKYKEKFIQVAVMENVEKDLQKYYSALDHALQKFHKDRMDKVNKSIREYWRLIYKGNDIDYIEIKTDESTPSAATNSTDKRKAYNYRVVQVKSGTEIDMKGRCSAGQKVLACLIIRMALSETFSMNCGILTLDEPTTNLDRQNIQSLCQAITEIVNDHEGSKNFQLIVITHDHEFLNAMATVDSFPHYWEVSRNNQCKSQIRLKHVTRV
ncbi:DNA repair protein RAD50 isoform X1 [Frankliniella occidentalis]|uniref:DNA repair protein RAD50 isoform X1 n=2 Tax=Frankliniella occidentalis TaxID=133901 RepID=A0A6J1SWE8_FRAOC|nr:DNA repair protein RAD50 isoform X1 [Frankliniella occidentalis]